MEFKNFDTASFLRDYWQKRPLFIKNPWQKWENPLTPEELAGLACEENVEARIITKTVAEHSADNAASVWTLEHGPFDAAIFATLGSEYWTLLVQAVDHYVPQVSGLIDSFRFIPDWRIDDVMVSYASDKGGVGPHFDNYDVFLIQGQGQRKWQVGALCDNGTAMKAHDGLRQLADFTPLQEWICQPGDILYIPPGMSHHGVAMGSDCMTYSIGFRAPSRSDLITHFCDAVLDDLRDEERYCDPDLAQQVNAGQINGAAIEKLHKMVIESLSDRDAFARWFGRYSTQSKYDDPSGSQDALMDSQIIAQHIARNTIFHRNIASRYSYIQNGEDEILLFVDGECTACNGPVADLAKKLCDQRRLTFDTKIASSQSALELLVKLVNQQSLLVS